MIIKAYCYESDSIETATVANTKRAAGIEDHYFCADPLKECGLPVFPKQRRDTGTCFFESGDDKIHGNHAELCPHRAARVPVPPTGRGGGHPGPRIVNGLIVPSVLGWMPPRTREWRQADRAEIIAMARNARPSLVPGNIEEVANAYDVIGRDQRTDHPLMIGGHFENYETAFRWTNDIEDLLNPAEWQGKIVVGNGHLRGGSHDNIWFFDFNSRINLENVQAKIEFVLRWQDVADEPSKGYVQTLGREPVRARMYWHGACPALITRNGRDHYRLTYDRNRPAHEHFAIRTRPDSL